MKGILIVAFVCLCIICSYGQNTNTAVGTGALNSGLAPRYHIRELNVLSSSGYLYPTVTVSGGGGGSGLKVGMEVSNRGLWVWLVNPGSGYTEAPTITISGGHGAGATVGVDYEDGQILDVYLINGGSGYTPEIIYTGGGGYVYTDTFLNPDGSLSVWHFNDQPFYSVPVVSVSYGNAIIQAVLEDEPVNTGENTALGFQSLYSNTQGKGNTATGYRSLSANISGSYNIANGSLALEKNTYGSYNAAIGSSALQDNTSGSYNSAMGAFTLMKNTTGSDNVAIGRSALTVNNTGSYNVALGTSALTRNTTGHYNIASGVNALYSNTIGNDNVAAGNHALFQNVSGNYNVALSVAALYSNTTGSGNIALGSNSVRSNTTGSYNVGLGDGALYANTIGNNNVATGYRAFRFATTGSNNSAYGMAAGIDLGTGSQNLFLGSNAGRGISSGSNNTLVGTNITLTSDVSNTIVLSDGTGSQRFYSPSTGNILLGYGNNPTDNGYKLDVNGTGRFASHLTLGALPPTSTASYDILTRNSTSGLIEKVSLSALDNSSRYVGNNFASPLIYNTNAEGLNNPPSNSFTVYDGYGAGVPNAPLSSPNWQTIMVGDKSRGFQIASDWSSTNISYRRWVDLSPTSWSQFWHSGNFDPANYIRNNAVGDWQVASSSTGTSYTQASLELREANFGTASATSPRLSFHWGGVVASQIGIESSGRIAVLNNPGTGYESLVASNITSVGSIAVGSNPADARLRITSEAGQTSFKAVGPQGYLTVDNVGSGENYYYAATGHFFQGAKVGIGTATLTERLNVDGYILTKGVKVNPDAFPDYVFKPQYKLRPLKEVETFIKANSHLPEVPSEAEVKKDGLELGEMSVTLLKKIEELTLYLIELKKENERQQDEINQLKAKRN